MLSGGIGEELDRTADGFFGRGGRESRSLQNVLGRRAQNAIELGPPGLYAAI